MPSWRLLGLRLAALACACGPVACASSAAVRAVERGDRVALAEAIAARERKGDLSNRDAARLAKTVAEHELRESTGAEAVDRVRDSSPCARELDGALADRMALRDAAGAHAALARIEGGGLAAGRVGALSSGDDPEWRAVLARGFVRAGDQEARRQALLDPDPLVRREAARAAQAARDGADVDALAEAARLDPEPIVRTESVRALASLGGGRAPIVVERLRDLWGSADDGLREDIARAWSRSPLWEGGGRGALLLLVASNHGPAAIEGAVAVLRARGADAEVADASLAQVERAIEAGARGTRIQALAQAPLDRSELLDAVRRASASDDREIRVAALGRLAGAGEPGAVGALEGLAAVGSPVAPRARRALAMAGDRRVQSWIEEDLEAAQPDRRLAAAMELAALGVAARGAPLLADADARVRTRAACTLIMAVRGK